MAQVFASDCCVFWNLVSCSYWCFLAGIAFRERSVILWVNLLMYPHCCHFRGGSAILRIYFVFWYFVWLHLFSCSGICPVSCVLCLFFWAVARKLLSLVRISLRGSIRIYDIVCLELRGCVTKNQYVFYINSILGGFYKFVFSFPSLFILCTSISIRTSRCTHTHTYKYKNAEAYVLWEIRIAPLIFCICRCGLCSQTM